MFVFWISLLIIQTIQPPREEQKIHWSFDIYSNESALSCDLWYMCIHYVCCKAPTHLHEELPLVCHPILFLPLGFNFSLFSFKVKWIPLHLQSKFDKSESRFPLEKMILHLYKPWWAVHHIIVLLVVSYHCWSDNWRGIAPTVWPAWNFDWLRMRLETLILEEKY